MHKDFEFVDLAVGGLELDAVSCGRIDNTECSGKQ